MICQKMAEDLVRLGLKKDDTILMHSSLSSLGHVDGGAETVIDTLLSVLSEGTLLLPALSCNTVGWDNMRFSVRNSPSCVGAITEYFRTRPGVMRSMHPTHSVCGIGVHAEEILGHHLETDTPAGAMSPYSLIRKFNGKILMLGCTLKPNTSMHAVEELSEPPYLYKPNTSEFELEDWDGNVIAKTYRTHNFRGYRQRYDRLADLMEIPCGKVLEAEAFLIDANTMWEKAHEKYLENPLYFVDIAEPKK